ncbi:MAG: CBS domain-containing protein [Ilumatobacter sp.]|nr:MAG: CBS domain-containing protein [Ilumatobacter sp.]
MSEMNGMDEQDERDPAVAFHGADAPVTMFMADSVVMVEPSTSVRRAAEVIVEASIGCIVVGAPGDIEGVVSERDIARVVAEGLDLDTTTVADIESTRLIWASADASIGDVAEEMMQDYVRHVLVGDPGDVAGVVSMRDVIAAYVT